jgi:hypothetical protein
VTRALVVLWPDGPRHVTEEQIRWWADDSYYDNADWYRCSACGLDARTEAGCLHDAHDTPIYEDGSLSPVGLDARIEWLQHYGEATFAARGGAA